MIYEKQVRRYCYEPEQIENYDKAVADKEHTWHCHHRGEVLPCGIYSIQDLKKFGLYWHRPASELIFLTKAEHNRLHKRGNNYSLGKKHSAEAKRKMSEAKKGEKCYWFGKKRSEETKRKISEAIKRHWTEVKL